MIPYYILTKYNLLKSAFCWFFRDSIHKNRDNIYRSPALCFQEKIYLRNKKKYTVRYKTGTFISICLRSRKKQSNYCLYDLQRSKVFPAKMVVSRLSIFNINQHIICCLSTNYCLIFLLSVQTSVQVGLII